MYKSVAPTGISVDDASRQPVVKEGRNHLQRLARLEVGHVVPRAMHADQRQALVRSDVARGLWKGRAGGQSAVENISFSHEVGPLGLELSCKTRLD